MLCVICKSELDPDTYCPNDECEDRDTLYNDDDLIDYESELE
jgi:hypothetical protein